MTKREVAILRDLLNPFEEDYKKHKSSTYIKVLEKLDKWVKEEKKVKQ